MKVFAGIDFAPGSNSKQVNVLIASTSRTKAVASLRAAGIDVSVGRVASHWGNGNAQEKAIALAAPGQVFVTENLRDGEYKPTGEAIPTSTRLTFAAVNKALKTRPGYAGEVLVQGNGYLYFMDGNAHAWITGSSIPVCRLNHMTLETILADFDDFAQTHLNAMRDSARGEVAVKVGESSYIVAFMEGKAHKVHYQKEGAQYLSLWGNDFRVPTDAPTPEAAAAIAAACRLLGLPVPGGPLTPQQRAQALIDGFRGLPGEEGMLKGLLCAEHVMQAAYEASGMRFIEAHKAACIDVDMSMIAARMDELRRAILSGAQ